MPKWSAQPNQTWNQFQLWLTKQKVVGVHLLVATLQHFFKIAPVPFLWEFGDPLLYGAVVTLNFPFKSPSLHDGA